MTHDTSVYDALERIDAGSETNADVLRTFSYFAKAAQAAAPQEAESQEAEQAAEETPAPEVAPEAPAQEAPQMNTEPGLE